MPSTIVTSAAIMSVSSRLPGAKAKSIELILPVRSVIDSVPTTSPATAQATPTTMIRCMPSISPRPIRTGIAYQGRVRISTTGISAAQASAPANEGRFSDTTRTGPSSCTSTGA